MSIFDMEQLDDEVYKMVAPLQVCANQAAEIEKVSERKNLSDDEK